MLRSTVSTFCVASAAFFRSQRRPFLRQMFALPRLGLISIPFLSRSSETPVENKIDQPKTEDDPKLRYRRLLKEIKSDDYRNSADFGRCCYQLSKSTKGEISHEYVKQGLAVVKEAIRKQNENFQQCYKWYAFLLDEWSQRQGKLAAMRNAKRVKTFLSKAYDVDHEDVELLKYIGDWNRRHMFRKHFKKVYRWFVSEYPDASLEEAICSYRHANRMSPSLKNRLLIVECMLQLGLADAARTEMQEIDKEYFTDEKTVSAYSKELLEKVKVLRAQTARKKQRPRRDTKIQ